MQLYAFDQARRVISAFDAHRRCDYSCIECGQVVRLRAGSHRHPHFFHLAATNQCSLHAKSMEHIQTQLYIESELPSGEVFLEYRFPEIGRIADVAWIKEKIIFEIQCSPITRQEVQARNRDYHSLGFEVVWILHDCRYNGFALTPVESCLGRTPFYFTNMNSAGEGMIYDQFSIQKGGRRVGVLSPLPLNLAVFHRQLSEKETARLQSLEERVCFWPFYFSGDLLDVSLQRDSPSESYVAKAQDLEARFFPKVRPMTAWEKFKTFYHRWVVKPYNVLFQIILESHCAK